MTLWKGRIDAGMADAVADYTVSLPFDQVLAPDDLAGSRAHVKGLAKAGILTDSDAAALQDALAQRALEAGDTYLPGYTHMQRAQPVLLAHHLLAHGWALARDVDRLLTTVDRLNISPLGAGALAGSSLPLQPDFVAAELGFHGPFENSLDAVSDRDFVAESLFDLALLGVL